MKKLLIPALLALASHPASAAVNLGFEQGNTSGWAVSGTASAVTGFGSFTPQLGQWFGLLQTGAADTYSTMTRTVTLSAGTRLRGFVGFATSDYLPFNDDAYLRVNGTPLFTASVASVGAGGNSGWVPFSFQAPTAGSYTIELGVRNRFDNQFQSFALVDAVVPEPATWALLIAGFGMVGFAARRRRPGLTATTA